jgi:hypothetical protein
MTPSEYISAQDPARREILANIHEIIMDTDKTVVATVGKMMAKEMILYYGPGNAFKYGLASVKDYMSLHVMPMYGFTAIYDKFSKLLDKAKFQKGCINFKTADAMPLQIVKELLVACEPIDLAAVLEQLKKSKKK